MDVVVKNTTDENGVNKVRFVKITIGDTEFKLTESIDGKLCVNKSWGMSDDDGAICVFPRQSNELEIR